MLRELPSDSVDAVITDPPYNSGGRSNSERTGQTSRGKYVSSDALHSLSSFDGDNRDQRSFTRWLALIVGECVRVCRVGGSLLVFADWRQLPATSDGVQIGGATWQGTVVWHKPNARPRRGGFRAQAEYLVWASNGPLARQDIYLPGVFSAHQPRGRQRRHITQKPVDGLMDELVRICPPGGTVLDPFAGAGSTGVAAVASGRRFIGIDLSAENVAITEERLTAVK